MLHIGPMELVFVLILIISFFGEGKLPEVSGATSSSLR
jgi:Sec-independent protein translocase protein TatA